MTANTPLDLDALEIELIEWVNSIEAGKDNGGVALGPRDIRYLIAAARERDELRKERDALKLCAFQAQEMAREIADAMSDNEARARELAADVVLPLTGYVQRGNPASLKRAEDMLAAALRDAEARGRVEGLREAQTLLLGRAAGSAYRQIESRLASLQSQEKGVKG
jgi:hypothetical protein